MSNPVSYLALECVEQLGRIATSAELKQYESEVLPGLWSDELARLRVRTENMGAHQTGPSSLDYHLREASHLKSQISRVLGRLQPQYHTDWQRSIS